MPKLLTKRSVKSVPVARLQRVFALSSALTEATDELLEESGAYRYRKEFLEALKESAADIKAGRVRTITSVRDLLKD